MPNPWDVPAWPIRGDERADDVYMGIGRVTSTWEIVESELSSLYSFFVGHYDDLGALLAYGQGTIFRMRYQALCDASAGYFVKHPNQSVEADFCEICRHLVGYSDRRNEVAHGVVFDVQNMMYFKDHIAPDARGRRNYMLIPPFQWIKKHNPQHGGPAFAYASAELMGLWALLFNLAQAVRVFIQTLLPPEMKDTPPPLPEGA